jgi:hypothetical protein
MLYEFKSKATGTVVMTSNVAERILSIIGKDAGPQGIITLEQINPAIAALQEAIELEDRASRSENDSGVDPNEADDAAHHRSVSLRQRAHPFIELLRDAYKAEERVTWGV